MPVALSAWIDVSNVRPGTPERAHLVVEIVATGDPTEVRPPTSTVLALDVSSSMRGTPIQQVIKSVDKLLDGFRASDRVGVVAFSENASTVVDLVAVDDAGKRLVRARVVRLVTERNTNVEAGLDLASKMLEGEARPGVVLLSDGVPNRGASSADALREVVKRHRPGVTFSSLGYGAYHSEDMLSAVATSGGGTYAFVSDPAVCARAFARAVGAQADVVASGIELVIGLGEGIELLGFVGREDSKMAREGVMIALGDMVHEARRVIVCEVNLKATADRFGLAVADLALRWKGGEARTDVTVEIADRPCVPVVPALERALLVHADVTRATARALADAGNFAGAGVVLRKMMARIVACPGFVLGGATALGDAHEALLDDAVAMERNPDVEDYANFRRTNVAERLAAPSSRAVGQSVRMVEEAAGPLPEAYLRLGEKRIKLKHEITIGRSSDCDVPVVSHSVTRRHAEVFVNEGAFFVEDLGGTNGVLLNGVRIRTAKLSHGDVLLLGDVEIRFEDR